MKTEWQAIVKLNKWDHRMLEVATIIALWSKDPKHKVGAVIADPNNYIVSSGFNGPPAGFDDDQELPDIDRIRSKLSIHAEANALLRAGERARGGTLYVTPLSPCIDCASLIIQAGIKELVYCQGYTLERWQEEQTYARQMLRDAGIIVTLA